MYKKMGSNGYLQPIIIALLLVLIILYITNNIPKTTQNISITNEQPPLDEFYNVHKPPLRNFSTYNNQFTQMGILKYNGANQQPDFLPLFGKQISRDQWQYYTISNNGSFPGIKLNLRNEKGRNLMDDTGAPELYDNDTVMVDGYDKSMIVSIYRQKHLYYV